MEGISRIDGMDTYFFFPTLRLPSICWGGEWEFWSYVGDGMNGQDTQPRRQKVWSCVKSDPMPSKMKWDMQIFTEKRFRPYPFCSLLQFISSPPPAMEQFTSPIVGAHLSRGTGHQFDHSKLTGLRFVRIFTSLMLIIVVVVHEWWHMFSGHLTLTCTPPPLLDLNCISVWVFEAIDSTSIQSHLSYPWWAPRDSFFPFCSG